jgi:hypothetical protein
LRENDCSGSLGCDANRRRPETSRKDGGC